MVKYDESSIKHLEPLEHIRKRAGMYIGKLGNGTSADDGIYVLLKEVLDNAVDEFRMKAGKKIVVDIGDLTENGQRVIIQDFGRGIPLGALVDCVSKINTGGKYDSNAFQKSVGMNGVGTKAVNALSSNFKATAQRDGKIKTAEFKQGELIRESKLVKSTTQHNGTTIEFTPDRVIFGEYEYQTEYIEKKLFDYACLNPGLELSLVYAGNEKKFLSTNGLFDLINSIIAEGSSAKELEYPLIHLKSEDVEVVMSHGNHYGEEIHSYVNGQNTTQGGTHVSAFKEGIVRAIRDYFKKTFEPQDIRGGIVAVVSIRIQEPLFESQTKTKLGSTHTTPPDHTGKSTGQTIKAFVGDFVNLELDNYLHRNVEHSKMLLGKINQNELERKELAGIRDKAKELAKEASLNNRKLRDCKIHWNSTAKAHQERKAQTTIFITEGDSAAGPITNARDSAVQAVFPLRGKPFNCFGKTRRAIYDNEELHMLQSALGIEDGIEGLRYNNVVIATDADVDGMHIRMLVTTFFLQYYPDLIKEGHLYVLQTPLFRVRNKKETKYCYSEAEKEKAIRSTANPEITRFKGLGEISVHEFEEFIGKNIRLEPIIIGKNTDLDTTLRFYMGANTPERQQYICGNLVIEE